MKDTHLSALQERLKDLGGSYFPRKGRDLLEGFDGDTWRREQRTVVQQEEESSMGVFERWGQMGEEEAMDWEAVAGGLVQGTRAKVCLRRAKLIVGSETG